MNILFFADNFAPERNAQASRVYERACYWVRWGHQVTVLTCAPNFPDGKVFPGYRNRWRQVEEMSGIRVVRVKTYIAPNAGRYRRILDFLSYMVTAFLAAFLESPQTWWWPPRRSSSGPSEPASWRRCGNGPSFWSFPTCGRIRSWRWAP